MEKPEWRRRASRYVVDSPYMRLRMDEVELPNGTIVPNYYVRESRGYSIVIALTPDDRVVLVRQYRYGSDAIHLELPGRTAERRRRPARVCPARAGGRDRICSRALRTGRRVSARTGSVNSRAYVYAASGARIARAPNLDPTEHLTVELAPLALFRTMLGDGRIDAGGSIAAGYLALDKLRAL